MQYTITYFVDGIPNVVDCANRRECYFRLVKILIEKKNISVVDLEPFGCDLFKVAGRDELNPTPEILINLIRSRNAPEASRRDHTRYSRMSYEDYGVIKTNDGQYVLYNQNSVHRLNSLTPFCAANDVSYKETGDVVVAAGNLDPAINFNMKKSPNVILYGPPGTGKTYNVVPLANRLVQDSGHHEKPWDELLKPVINAEEFLTRDEEHGDFSANLGECIHFITFHQSYSYEDFIGGLRPDVDDATGGLKFKWQPGIFLRACAAAFKQAQSVNSAKKPGETDVDAFLAYCSDVNRKSYSNADDTPFPSVVLVIDEINRANMSRVFGELITLLEEDKRLGGREELTVQLPNRPDCKFGVPKNLFILGTMNTADKSLALLDLALRRRFEFLRLDPDPSLIKNTYFKEFLTKLNKEIAVKRKSLDYGIGHAYFPDIADEIDVGTRNIILTGILQRKIVPLLQEYFGGDDGKVIEILKGAGVSIDATEQGLISIPVSISVLSPT